MRISLRIHLVLAGHLELSPGQPWSATLTLDHWLRWNRVGHVDPGQHCT